MGKMLETHVMHEQATYYYHTGEGNGYVASCPELDIASQGDSVEQERDNLKEALDRFLQSASDEEIGQRTRDEVYVTRVQVAVG